MRTVVGPLASVDPQVVEEVVPFSKHFLTIGMSAREQSDDPPVVWVLILVDHELVGGWNVLVDSNRV